MIDPLIIIMLFLGIIELGLIFSVRKLTNVLENMNDKIKRFEEKVNTIGHSVGEIAGKIKDLEILKNSKFHITGDTALGKVDVDVDLRKKDT